MKLGIVARVQGNGNILIRDEQTKAIYPYFHKNATGLHRFNHAHEKSFEVLDLVLFETDSTDTFVVSIIHRSKQ